MSSGIPAGLQLFTIQHTNNGFHSKWWIRERQGSRCETSTGRANPKGCVDNCARYSSTRKTYIPQLSDSILVSHPHPVSRIALVSPERSKQIEAVLFRIIQSGQLKTVSDKQLIDLLDQVNLYLAPIGSIPISFPQMEQTEGKTAVQKPSIVVRRSLPSNLGFALISGQYQRRKGLEDDLDF